MTASSVSLESFFPLASYGFANAFSDGRFEYNKGNGLLGIYNSLSQPTTFFDCASSTRFVVKILRKNGVDANACLMMIPTPHGSGDLHITEHLVTHVKTENSPTPTVIGFTPYDKLLGIYPCVEATQGSAAAKLLQTVARVDKDDEILESSLALGGILVRIGHPEDRSMLLPVANIPLSSYKRRGLFGITSLSLTLCEIGGASLFYSVEFFGKGKSDSFPLTIAAHRGIKVNVTHANFALLQEAIIDGGLDFSGFCHWLQKNQSKLTNFSDTVYCPPRSPLLKRALDRRLLENWSAVVLFLGKLSQAMASQG